MELIEKIKKYIKDNNLSQKSFAELIEVKPSTLSRWLNGKQLIGRQSIKIIEVVIK